MNNAIGHGVKVRVIFRPMLVSGMLSADLERGSWLILVDSEQSEPEQTVSLFHEMLHLIGLLDEKKVEAMAQKLAAACPEILPLLHGVIEGKV